MPTAAELLTSELTARGLLTTAVAPKGSPLAVTDDPAKGRIGVATRDLRPGSLILRERAYAWAPEERILEAPNRCHQCCRVQTSPQTTLEPCRVQGGCKFLRCMECLADRVMTLIHDVECAPIGTARQIHSMLGAPLRDLILLVRVMRQRLVEIIAKDTSGFERLLQLQTHADDYKQLYKEAFDAQEQSFAFMMEGLSPDFSRGLAVDALMAVWLIATVNSFGVGPGRDEGVALFVSGAMLSHSCAQNTIDTCLLDPEAGHAPALRLAACRPISENTELTINYLPYTLVCAPTVKRQLYLRRAKFFVCGCERCSDPTEHGTFAAAGRCAACGSAGAGAWVVPTADSRRRAIDSVRGTDDNYAKISALLDWACLGCGAVTPTADRSKAELEAATDLAAVEEERHDGLPPDARRSLMAARACSVLGKHSQSLHKHHHLLLRMRQLAVRLLCHDDVVAHETDRQSAIRVAMTLASDLRQYLPPYHPSLREIYLILSKLFAANGNAVPASQNELLAADQERVLGISSVQPEDSKR